MKMLEVQLKLLVALQVLTGAQLSWALLDEATDVMRLLEMSNVCTEGSCYPATGDLLIGRAQRLSSTSTCGQNQPEPFCIVSHLQDKKKCFICDSASPDSDKVSNSHHIDNVVTTFAPNRLKTWWQSENGLQNVTIQLDLEAEFHFTHLIMTFKTFRPAAMVIERSADFGTTWQVYRYFAFDCESSFPMVSKGPMQRVDDIICDSRYSDIEPSTEGEVIFRVLDPAFQIADPYSPKIQNLLKITNLRINFTKLHTLGDNLLDSRIEIKEKYYYSIYDMVVRGSCFCYGHASECAPVQGGRQTQVGMVHGHCICDHNTKGLNCEQCLDFYHDLPWRPAEGPNTNACKKCNCNHHAYSCHFDMALFVASGNTSGGVCNNCQHNTAGHQCEHCKPSFFQHPERDIRDPSVCQSCNCDPLGSLNGGICDGVTDVQLGLIAGQCRCKANVEGEHCNRCKQAHYGLSDTPDGCNACSCNPLGTASGRNPCDTKTGICVCKRLVTGRDCDQCVSDHWGLSNDLDGCRPCDCDLGGAVSNECDQLTGQCMCKDHMVGRQCDQVESGFYFIHLDHYTYEAEDAEFGPGVFAVQRPHPKNRNQTWTGIGLAHVPVGAFLEFSVDNIPRSLEYNVLIRYEPQIPSVWEEVLMTVVRPAPSGAESHCNNAAPEEDHQVTSLHPASRYVVFPRSVCFESGLNYTLRLSLPLSSALNNFKSPYILIDSIVLMPHCKSLDIFSALEGGSSFERSGWDRFQHYRCLENSQSVVKTPMTDICLNFIFTISALLHQGAKECQCDPQGSLSSLCNPSGGSCKCKANVIGRNCDRCSPMTFHFGPNGCRVCKCDPQGSQDPFCSQFTGQCNCLPGVHGLQCNRCLPGHWAFPTCRPCACNGHAENCDSQTGRCLNCSDHTTGFTCDRCLDGYYGNPLLGSGDHCRPCMCPDVPGSMQHAAVTCYLDKESWEVICVCKSGYRGARCEECSPGYFSNFSENGQCHPCQCSNNIDMMDQESCDNRSGKCLRCLYHTEGPSCKSCKLGYFGNALLQDCKKCICNQLGTDASSCLSFNECYCNQTSGQCQCLPNVVGLDCSRCATGTWNMANGRGCQPCNCEAEHSYSVSCDEISGQCSCLPGFGGRTCSECQELFWGDPEVHCHECQCNTYGISQQQCDKTSGQCVCVNGISGPQCDVCARGYTGIFPDCHTCHQCFTEWDSIIGQLTSQTHHFVNKLNSIKDAGVTEPFLKFANSIERGAIDILDQNVASQPLTEIEELLQQGRDLIWLLSQTLNHTEQNLVEVNGLTNSMNHKMESVMADGQKLEQTVRDLLHHVDFIINSDINGATNSVTKHFEQSLAAEARANRSTDIRDSLVESSSHLRGLTDDKVNQTKDVFLSRHTDHIQRLDNLAVELQATDLSELNHQTCCSPAGLDLHLSPCGSWDCLDTEGRPLCEGNQCESLLMRTHNCEQEIQSVMIEVEKLSYMVSVVKAKADKEKLSAHDILMRTNRSKQEVDWSNKELRSLIRQIRDFLIYDAADLENIELVANEVMAMQMPVGPAQLQNITDEIWQKVGELDHVDTILQQTAKNIQRAENVMNQAWQASEKAADVKASAEIIHHILRDAQRAQSAASNTIQQSMENIQNTKKLLSSMEIKMTDVELKLYNNLQKQQLLNKNMQLMKDSTIHDTLSIQDNGRITQIVEKIQKDLNSELQQKYDSMEQLIVQKAEGVDNANKRAVSMQQEAKQLLLLTHDKLQLLKDLEKLYEDNQRTLELKEEQLHELETSVKELLQQISHRVTIYSSCF